MSVRYTAVLVLLKLPLSPQVGSAVETGSGGEKTSDKNLCFDFFYSCMEALCYLFDPHESQTAFSSLTSFFLFLTRYPCILFSLFLLFVDRVEHLITVDPVF